MDNMKKDLAVIAAILYYEKDKTQSEIGKELNISRSYVSQLLIYARDTGIVKISIQVDEFSLRMIRKEIELKGLFPMLKQVYIMESATEDFTSLNIGKFAAPYIADMINDADIIGINQGLSVEKTVKHLRNQNLVLKPQRKVVQMMGGFNSNNSFAVAQPNQIVKELSDVLGCESYYLNCPALIDQAVLREHLVKERSINEVMNLWKKIDVAIMGLGVADERSKFFNLYNSEFKKMIKKSNATGELNTSYFDEKGKHIPLLEEKVIGISIQDLKDIPCKVVICTGAYKSKALLGALRGGLIDVLITDSITVNSIQALI